MQVYEDDFNRVVKSYYDDLKKYKPISKAKEKRLIKLAKMGDIKAKNEIIESNLRFVFDFARRYARKGVPISELISEGNLALFKAIDKFDDSNDVKFITYAVWWIRQAMTELVRKNSIRNASEVEDEGNVSIHTSAMYDEEDDIVYEIEEQSFYMDDSETEKERENSIMVSSLIGQLNGKEKDIIESYYGINGKKEETLFDIGKRYNLTCERVRQLKSNALRKLRTEALIHCGTEEFTF